MPPTWTTFARRDLAAVIATARSAASAGTAVELVVESPPLHWWQRRSGAVRDQARIVLAGPAYPVHVRLFTTHGADAGRKINRRAGWTTSNSHGEAVLMMKAAAATAGDFDASELVTGTVDALDDLHLGHPKRGWRFQVVPVR